MDVTTHFWGFFEAMQHRTSRKENTHERTTQVEKHCGSCSTDHIFLVIWNMSFKYLKFGLNRLLKFY